jgi:glycosyltransferase involved in cell wall biosynthesis
VADTDLPDADVVIATWWETAEWVDRLGPSKGAKVYFIQHHETFEYLPADRVKATYRLPLHKVVVAPWLRDVMRDDYGDSKADLVLNAVDHRQFHAPVRTRQPIPTVGFMYSEAEFKAAHVGIAALRRLKTELPDLKVISFGLSRPMGLDFLGADLEFHLSPRQDMIRECYSRCDVWLTSSRSEGFNLPALEAMACRTPVVATRTGWPQTAVVDGHNGYLADVGDDEALSRGMLKVLRAPNWIDFSQHAHDTAEPLSWDQAYPLFLESLKHACRRARQGEIVGQPLALG